MSDSMRRKFANSAASFSPHSSRSSSTWAGVAPLRPPHLAALIAWEGSSDYYRELARHGGILCDFLFSWYPRQCVKLQHGVGTRGPVSRVTGEPVSGPETLPEDELARNRADVPGEAPAVAGSCAVRCAAHRRGHRRPVAGSLARSRLRAQ